MIAADNVLIGPLLHLHRVVTGVRHVLFAVRADHCMASITRERKANQNGGLEFLALVSDIAIHRGWMKLPFNYLPAFSLCRGGRLRYNDWVVSNLVEVTMRTWLSGIDPSVLTGGVIIIAGILASIVFWV